MNGRRNLLVLEWRNRRSLAEVPVFREQIEKDTLTRVFSDNIFVELNAKSCPRGQDLALSSTKMLSENTRVSVSFSICSRKTGTSARLRRFLHSRTSRFLLPFIVRVVNRKAFTSNQLK